MKFVDELKEKKLKQDAEKLAKDLAEIEQTKLENAREIQAKKNKMEKELTQYKNDNFNYGIGQPLSWRLCKFFTVISRDNVSGLSQFDELARKMNLTEYFESLNKTDKPVKKPTYNEDFEKTN